MPRDSEDMVKVLIEAAVRHDDMLRDLAGAMTSTAESVAALTTLMAAKERRERNQPAGRRDTPAVALQPSPDERPDPPDPGTTSIEHQALLAHYDQLRSSLGRERAHFYVRVLQGVWDLDGDGEPDVRLLALSGQPASLASRIRVGGFSTSVAADWKTVRRDGGETLLICRRRDVGEVEYGTEVQCYAGSRLVGVGVWPAQSFEEVRDYAIEMG